MTGLHLQQDCPTTGIFAQGLLKTLSADTPHRPDTMSKEDSAGIAMDSRSNMKLTKCSAWRADKRYLTCLSPSTTNTADPSLCDTQGSGGASSPDLADGLISTMTIRLWTSSLWRASGGCSNRFGIKDSCIEVAELCLILLAAQPCFLISRLDLTTKIFQTHPSSLPSHLLVTPIQSSLLGQPPHGPFPAT